MTAYTDWFAAITGFTEESYHRTQQNLLVRDNQIISKRDGHGHSFGHFSLIPLEQLRQVATGTDIGPNNIRIVLGDARALHSDPQNAGATFQVASQFNSLEMVGPDVSPEQGVTRYVHDRTQGPACAIAAGAGTIWRNYLIPLEGQVGQSAERQLNALDALETELVRTLGIPASSFWTMRNGYTMAKPEGLKAIALHLRGADESERDRLRRLIKVGWHRNVDATDMPVGKRHQVSQVYCSAVPMAYNRIAAEYWEPLARLVLEAAYEATLLAASADSSDGKSRRALLTGLGGGAFGNNQTWITDAIDYALARVPNAGLELLMVGHREVPGHFRKYAQVS